MTSNAAWSPVAEHDERAAGLIVEPVNLFTGAPPPVVAIELSIMRRALDRQGNPVGLLVPEPTGMVSYRTLSGRVVFPGFDRLPGRTTAPQVHNLRFAVDAPGLIADPADLDLVFATQGAVPVRHPIRLVPAPDYRFPPQVTVLRGVVHGHLSDDPLLVRAVPRDLRDQALTSYGYLGREAPTAGGELSFGLGLRSGRRPDRLEIVDAATGRTVDGNVPTPASPSDLIVVQL